MIKRILLAAPASLALIAAAPLVAQDDADETAEIVDEENPMAAMGELFGEMFKVEPLTPEQEARMPTALSIADKILPDGTMAQMFEKMMGGFLGPIMEMGPPPASQTVSRGIGLSQYDLDITEDEMAEIAGLIDPAWKERSEREAAIFPEIMATMMTAIEPGMRKAMAEMYAIRFEQGELVQLEGFFSTELGAKFARESYAMATDPRVMGASMEVMPEMVGALSGMEAKVAEATADLPAKRTFAELSAREKKRISELTGYTVEELEQFASAETDEWTDVAEEMEATD